MKILCVAGAWPWPERSGYQVRLANTVRALAALGDVELFCIVPADQAMPLRRAMPEGMDLPPSRVVAAAWQPRSASTVLRWSLSRLPSRVLWRDWSRVSAMVSSLGAERYDLVWWSYADAWPIAGKAVAGPTIVDLECPEQVAIDQHRGMRSPLRPPATRALADVFERLDARRWDRLTERLGAVVDAVVVCSELDRRRLDLPNVAVIPNGYEEQAGRRPARDRRTDRRDRPPVLTMIGLMSHGPNEDGARFFVSEVLPRIRAAVPEVELRVVGRTEGRLEDLAGTRGVTVVGEVESVDDELDRADVAVVPLRFGGGTRVKVLEAFAAKVPVVSTTIGCEGLDAEDGRHLLVADRPDDLAHACMTLLRDPTLAHRLIDEGYRLYDERYRAGHARAAVRDLVLGIASSTRG